MATRRRVDSRLVTGLFWKRVEPLISVRERPANKKDLRKPCAGRPPKPARQDFEAVVHVLFTGCQWRAPPKERFSNAGAVHSGFEEKATKCGSSPPVASDVLADRSMVLGHSAP